MASYALIVGIAQYGTKGLPQLEKTTTDAEAVAQVLEQYGNFTEVQRLPSRINPETKKREMVNQPVTAKELWQAIETLLNEQARNNDALIYFTGHGLKVEGRSGKPRGYLATSDCQIKADVIKSEGNKDEARISEVQSAILFDDLNDLISKSELSSLVVLLDCCHSGNFIERNLITNSFGISLEKDYYLIAACRGFQTGKARKSEKNSVFTGALLRGLRAENASSDGEISCDRLYDYISRELRGASQQPLKLGWGTSIILVNNPLAIAPAVVEVPAVQAVVNRDNPYLGLMAFDADKKDYFFGRELAVRGIGERLSKSRFLAVIGPSGCGKSSLVKAGVLPKLNRDVIPDSSQWEVKIFTPGRYPLEKLEQALANREPGKTFLLFIDQFEELFTLGSDESQQRKFISKITEEATKTDGDTRVIVAIRGDFLDRCAGYEETANLINCTQPTTYVVTPMTTAELAEAIEQPAAKHAIAFESGLVEQIIIDVVNQAGALPLLQYALAELWRVCITDSNHSQPQLTFNGYEQIRGVKGALEKRADELYQNLAEADQKFVRCLFLELVQLGENQEVTRRHATWQDLLDKADSKEQLDRVTRQLANWNQRLIITDENKVEVAHEALLSEWRRLREWIEDNRDNLRLERRLEGDCQEWSKQNRSEGLLLTGTWLAAIDDWVNKDNPRLSLLESEFLTESLGRRDREEQQQINRLEKEIKLTDEKIKAQKQRTKWAIASGILLTFTLALGLLSNVLQGQKREQESSQVGLLIGKSQQLLESNLQLEALIASVEALKEMKKLGRENQDELQKIQSVIYKVQERSRLEYHQHRVTSVDFTPHGEKLASAGEDGTIVIWDLKSEKIIPNKLPKKHEGFIWRLRFSPDSKILASASRDSTIKLWNISGELQKSIKQHKGQVFDITFSKDSKKIASAGEDGYIKVWDIEKKETIRTIRDKKLIENKDYQVYGLDFNPKNPSILVSTSYKGHDLYIWDLSKKENNDHPKYIGQNNLDVVSVRFNQEGSMIVSCDKHTIKLWNSEGKQIGEINDSENNIIYAEFSSDSKFIGYSTAEGVIKVGSVEQVQKGLNKNLGKHIRPIAEIHGHTGSVVDIRFRPHKNALNPLDTIASGSYDKTVRIWNFVENKTKVGEDKNVEILLKEGCKKLKSYLKINESLSQAKRSLCPN